MTIDSNFLSSDPYVQQSLQSINSVSTSQSNPDQENGAQFAAMIEEEMLSQEFQGRLTQTITQFSQLPSQHISDQITHAHGELMATFGTEMPEIDNLQSLRNISDPTERKKAQINMSLVNFSAQIENLNPEQKRLAISQLSNLNSTIQTQQLHNQLTNTPNSNGPNLGFNLLNIGSMTPQQIQYTIEAQLNEMYKPLMDIGFGSSNDDDDDNNSNSGINQINSITNNQFGQLQNSIPI